MSLEPAELLARLSAAMRSDIAPAIDDEYAKTQAFMAAVILERLAKQSALGSEHGEAQAADLAELAVQLEPLLGNAPAAVARAAAALTTPTDIATLGPLIEAIYAWGIDQPEAASALDAVRRALRRDIDRRMEIAR